MNLLSFKNILIILLLCQGLLYGQTVSFKLPDGYRELSQKALIGLAYQARDAKAYDQVCDCIRAARLKKKNANAKILNATKTLMPEVVKHYVDQNDQWSRDVDISPDTLIRIALQEKVITNYNQLIKQANCFKKYARHKYAPGEKLGFTYEDQLNKAQQKLKTLRNDAAYWYLTLAQQTAQSVETPTDTIRGYLNKAKGFASSSSIRDAVKLIENQLYFNQGKALAEQGQAFHQKAIQLLEKAHRLNPKDIQTKQLLGQLYYEECQHVLQQSASIDYRAAYTYLEKVQLYTPGYEDVSSLLQEVKVKAVQRVVVFPFQNRSGITQAGAIEQKQYESIVQSINSKPFMEVVPISEVQRAMQQYQMSNTDYLDLPLALKIGHGLNAHYVIKGNINQINILPPNKRIVAKRDYEAYVYYQNGRHIGSFDISMRTTNDLIYNRYNYAEEKKLKASVTKYEKRSSVVLKAEYTVIDVLAKQEIAADGISDQEEFFDYWGEYEGNKDVLAVDDEAQKLVDRSETFPPSEVDMINRTIDRMTRQIISNIRSLFN